MRPRPDRARCRARRARAPLGLRAAWWPAPAAASCRSSSPHLPVGRGSHRHLVEHGIDPGRGDVAGHRRDPQMLSPRAPRMEPWSRASRPPANRTIQGAYGTPRTRASPSVGAASPSSTRIVVVFLRRWDRGTRSPALVAPRRTGPARPDRAEAFLARPRTSSAALAPRPTWSSQPDDRGQPRLHLGRLEVGLERGRHDRLRLPAAGERRPKLRLLQSPRSPSGRLSLAEAEQVEPARLQRRVQAGRVDGALVIVEDMEQTSPTQRRTSDRDPRA